MRSVPAPDGDDDLVPEEHDVATVTMRVRLARVLRDGDHEEALAEVDLDEIRVTANLDDGPDGIVQPVRYDLMKAVLDGLVTLEARVPVTYPEHGYKFTDPNDGLGVCFCGAEWYGDLQTCERLYEEEDEEDGNDDDS